MKQKCIILVAAASVIASASAARPSVSGVSIAQGADTRNTTITYTLANAPAVITFDVQTNCTVEGRTTWASIGGANLQNVTADSAVWRRMDAGGPYTITWIPECEWFDHLFAAGRVRAVVKAWPLDDTPDYMAVDIALGASPNSQRYYPSEEFVPGGVLSNKAYRTTKFLMRKIPAKYVTWTMGPAGYTHSVTLTNNYYMAVFETTQTQYALVASNVNYTAHFYLNEARGMRPAEAVRWRGLRNNANNGSVENYGYNWPHDPYPGSFFDLLRTRTGLDFDLPSEAQWEFACRAGMPNGFWNTGVAVTNTTRDANMPGRYRFNGGLIGGSSAPAQTVGTTNGTNVCGSYAPNAWGLYDMHGNVAEMCLDFYEADAVVMAYGGQVNVSLTDPKTALSGTTPASEKRVTKGTSYYFEAKNAVSGARSSIAPWDTNDGTGFRVMCRAGLD